MFTLNILYEAIYLIICYLIGSIPSGLIVGKLFKKIDIRNHGSGNLGATNAVRVLGKPLGTLVGFMDVMKGGAAILLAQNVFESNSFYDTHIPVIIFGVVAVLGHIYPIFAQFRGGKAVATSGGVILFSAYPIFIIGVITFIIALLLTKYVSLASTIVATTIFISSVIGYFYRDELNLKNIDYDIYFVITISILFLFVILRHIPNYKRLLKGTERKIGQKKTNNEI